MVLGWCRTGNLQAAVDLQIMKMEKKIAEEILKEINSRLDFLKNVGLDYLTLDRKSNTLSGGEAQRIKITRELVEAKGDNNIYIMDEPTTGLHMADITRLLRVFDELLDAGHSVLVIEHNMEVIASADHIIDLGPGGGDQGGRVIACGRPDENHTCAESCCVIGSNTVYGMHTDIAPSRFPTFTSKNAVNTTSDGLATWIRPASIPKS